MKREIAWYPLAYPEPEMAKCPRCEREEETQEHFFKCKQDDPERGEKDWGGRETKTVAEKYLDMRSSNINNNNKNSGRAITGGKEEADQ
ncbi:hypothetical protein EV182_005239 [Spiromyces aspiralis]|uniref:Uncharacterized protein n=1 Tax=Spiromyces aspiralis TaxID=68401 RepID=A0ACC1HQ55_9FUNG|nr:hypothetical protein EV182_005239 [Spiromyces aspiralis]